MHRSDGSGTTYIFSDYLSNVSPTWAQAPGKGKELAWPVGLGGKGNEGVAGQVKQTPGAIGYVELAYAKQNRCRTRNCRTRTASSSLRRSSRSRRLLPAPRRSCPRNTDYRISIVNAPGKGAYPISSFTWLLVYKTQPDAAKGKKLVDFLHWYLAKVRRRPRRSTTRRFPTNMVAQLEKRLSEIQMASR